MWIFKEIWIFQRDPTLLDPLINLHEYISLELHVFTFKLLKIHLINEYKTYQFTITQHNLTIY